MRSPNTKSLLITVSLLVLFLGTNRASAQRLCTLGRRNATCGTMIISNGSLVSNGAGTADGLSPFAVSTGGTLLHDNCGTSSSSGANNVTGGHVVIGFSANDSKADSENTFGGPGRLANSGNFGGQVIKDGKLLSGGSETRTDDGITVHFGTLLLGAANVINAAAPGTMATGRSLATSGYPQTLDIRSISFRSTVLNIGHSASRHPYTTSSSSSTGLGGQGISNYYNSWDQAYFGASVAEVTSDRPVPIEWINSNGNGVNNQGSVVQTDVLTPVPRPLPEAKTVAALALLAAFAVWHERRRLAALMTSSALGTKTALVGVRGLLTHR